MKYHKPKSNKRELLVAACIGGIISLVVYALVTWYFQNYEWIFRSPLVIQKKVIIEAKPTPRISPKPVELKISPVKPQSGIVRQVMASETKEVIEKTYSPSDTEIIEYIKSKDWDDEVAVALAKSENYWNLTKSFDCKREGGVNPNGTYDHGLWQINDIHITSGMISLEDTLDCKKATDFAYGLYVGRGNTFTAWSAYTNGSYKNHL